MEINEESQNNNEIITSIPISSKLSKNVSKKVII